MFNQSQRGESAQNRPESEYFEDHPQILAMQESQMVNRSLHESQLNIDLEALEQQPDDQPQAPNV